MRKYTELLKLCNCDVINRVPVKTDCVPTELQDLQYVA